VRCTAATKPIYLIRQSAVRCTQLWAMNNGYQTGATHSPLAEGIELVTEARPVGTDRTPYPRAMHGGD